MNPESWFKTCFKEIPLIFRIICQARSPVRWVFSPDDGIGRHEMHTVPAAHTLDAALHGKKAKMHEFGEEFRAGIGAAPGAGAKAGKAGVYHPWLMADDFSKTAFPRLTPQTSQQASQHWFGRKAHFHGSGSAVVLKTGSSKIPPKLFRLRGMCPTYPLDYLVGCCVSSFLVGWNWCFSQDEPWFMGLGRDVPAHHFLLAILDTSRSKFFTIWCKYPKC